MRLNELIQELPVELVRGSPLTEISTLVEDSRQASDGTLFVARPGTMTDGRQFIADAIERGAVGVLVDPDAADQVLQMPHVPHVPHVPHAPHMPHGPAVLVSHDVRTMAAQLAERIHGDPSKSLMLIGVTGTNGKTTTAHLVHQILNRAGRRCGLIGTVLIDDGASANPADLTTPPAFELSRLLAAMVGHGCEAAVMEVSSHALQQLRVAALQFDGAIFTNLTGDHADYHGTMHAYAAAKAKLFESIDEDGWVVINADDPAAERMLRHCRARVISCSLTDETATCRAAVHAQTIHAADVTFRIGCDPCAEHHLRLPLIGLHNIYNALEAFATCRLHGVDAADVIAGLEQCTAPPGRLEPVSAPNGGPIVLVDYAHTDDALDNVLSALRPLVPDGGRLRTVFGCGGDRDRTKRPRMAAAAWRWSDEVVITSDNPRGEEPQSILDEIMTGVPAAKHPRTRCIVDRREAIELTINLAEARDVILIAGKGHEDYQITRAGRRPFDDRAIARSTLQAMASAP